MLKSSIKHILSMLPFVKSYLHGNTIILMLHRIAPIDPARLPENEDLKVDPQNLEYFIQDALKHGYRFISLDELYNHLQNNDFQDKKNLVITLDDGYKDNLIYGLPIFKKYQIPFCTYLCTSFLTKPNMWWFSIEDYLLSHDIFVWNNDCIEISTLTQKSRLFWKIREYVLKNMNMQKSPKKLLEELNIPHDEYMHTDLALSQKDIQQLLTYPFFTLGCHTESHPVFNNLSFSELECDVKISLDTIHNLFGVHSKHFCLPFGSSNEINKKYCDFMKTFNFKTIVTTRCGTIYPEHKNYCHVLPRIYINNTLYLKKLIKFRRKKIVTY